MTCERSEFVTNAYRYSASVANFELMSNLFIRKHIRKHIREQHKIWEIKLKLDTVL